MSVWAYLGQSGWGVLYYSPVISNSLEEDKIYSLKEGRGLFPLFPHSKPSTLWQTFLFWKKIKESVMVKQS